MDHAKHLTPKAEYLTVSEALRSLGSEGTRRSSFTNITGISSDLTSSYSFKLSHNVSISLAALSCLALVNMTGAERVTPQ